MLGSRLGRGTLSALAQLQGTRRRSGVRRAARTHPARAARRRGGAPPRRLGRRVLRLRRCHAVVRHRPRANCGGGAPRAQRSEALLPAAERAMAWVQGDGDPDGDGLVEYGGATPQGVASLANQGWKDSHDAVRHRDGSLAEGPIAMVEVQGYCHAAYRALADLREAFGTGDPASAATACRPAGRADRRPVLDGRRGLLRTRPRRLEAPGRSGVDERRPPPVDGDGRATATRHASSTGSWPATCTPGSGCAR